MCHPTTHVTGGDTTTGETTICATHTPSMTLTTHTTAMIHTGVTTHATHLTTTHAHTGTDTAEQVATLGQSDQLVLE